MDLSMLLHAFAPSWTSVALLLGYFTYLAVVGSILPGRIIAGATLSDGTRLHYRCNGLLLLVLLVCLLGIGSWKDLLSPTAIVDRGLGLLSTTLIFSVLLSFWINRLFHFLNANGDKSSLHGWLQIFSTWLSISHLHIFIDWRRIHQQIIEIINRKLKRDE